MYQKVFGAWLFLLLCHIKLSASDPNKQGNIADLKIEPSKNLYDIILSKCPDFGKTNLTNDYQDIFTKKCTNWTAISVATSYASETKTESQCLLLYEAMQLFCTKLKDHLSKIEGLVPKANYGNHNLNTICSKDNGLSLMQNTEHDVSNLTNSYCNEICVDIIDGNPIVSSMCQLAYYFSAFNTTKFIEKYELLHRENTDSQQTKQNSTTQNNHVESNKLDLVIEHGNEPSEPRFKESGKSQISESDNGNGTPNKIIPVAEKEKAPEANSSIPKLVINQADAPQVKEPSKIEQPKQKPSINEEDSENQEDDQEDRPEEVDEAEKPDSDNEQEPAMPENIGDSQKKPTTLNDPVNSYNQLDDDSNGDSNFFSYFTVIMCLVVISYIGYHNKQKILALLLEGKRGKRSGRQSRRPNSANYHKLDSNLEEAMSSSCAKNTSNVIY
ncbi:hypothetical protein ABEB36_000964 [Hypothenemus hampei]|uniref:Trans-Golgi network integral membrane protein 1 n=1 Tax=Hypothenemus hampei TaxID=57062 RepID=A0ABD1FD43_HYPHA